MQKPDDDQIRRWLIPLVVNDTGTVIHFFNNTERKNRLFFIRLINDWSLKWN